MARTNLIPISVYTNAGQQEALKAAAQRDDRSVSNFLLHLGLQRAAELGIQVFHADEAPAPVEKKRQRKASGRRR